ncbi:hypothetical protein EBU24_04250, partial [bacterium]|nr:hypothetical protein [bacterium]
MSSPAPADAKAKARKTAKDTPLENAQTLRSIYISGYEFPQWVLEPDRWDENSGEKSHKFDDTIVVYDVDGDLPQVKELVERREPVNMCINGAMERMYKQDELEKNFGWKHGAYSKSNPSKLYPNIGIYCHARVTNGVKTGAEEKNVHVMNLIGYAFDNDKQPDYQYFLNTYGAGKSDLKNLEDADKEKLKLDLIQRYRKIWLKACYICKLKGLKNLWYYGVGSGFFSELLPKEYNKDSGNFYKEIFAPAFGIKSDDFSESPDLHSTTTDPNDLTIPINFCKKYKINVQNLEPSSDKRIPDVLFTTDTTPANTLYINAWDPWSIIGNGNAGDGSLDGFWGRNSNMSVLGWSMTNSKLLPDIVGDDGAKTSKILSMKEILDKIQAAGSSGASSTMSGDTTPPPSKKVAQFFMTYEKNNNGGLNTEKQAEKIVNVVKCLIAKGYKHIGLTYSANQDQTIQVFSDYNYDKNSSTNTFENDQEKNISEEILNGSNQAAVLTKLNDIVKDGTSYSNFKKTFRVIPFTTMRYIKATDSNKVTASDLNETASGNNKECVAAAEEFLKLDDSIILGWCNQDCGGMDDTSSTKQKFAIGGGIAAGLSKATNTYIPEYLTFLESKWGQEVQKIVTDCSPDPKSADSTASPKSSPPAKSAPSKPLDDVIKDLIAGITNTEDPEATLLALSIKSSSANGLVYKYPPSGDGSLQEDKNLNSAEPNIKKMIEGFESAETGDDTNFYLGACRSIKAAYNLEMEGIKGDDTSDQVKAAKMRAKLLLNLRKNSLLLKVPARWDYATMKMGEKPKLTQDEEQKLFVDLQIECSYLKTGIDGIYNTEEAYELAKQLIPLKINIDIHKLEKQNGLLQKIYPTTERVYNPVEIKQLQVFAKDGKKQFERIQTQASLNCGRAALLNFFGTKDLLVKGDPSDTEKMFDLKSARPEREIDMGAICNLNSNCMKLFSDIYNDKDDGCPDSENYSDGVLGITLQILGYNTGDTMVFGKNPERFPSYNKNSEDTKLQNAPTNKNILGYLVNLDKAHW